MMRNGIVNAERKGEKKDEKRKAHDIARRMKNAGKPLCEIIEFTGLSLEDVQNL